MKNTIVIIIFVKSLLRNIIEKILCEEADIDHPILCG